MAKLTRAQLNSKKNQDIPAADRTVADTALADWSFRSGRVIPANVMRRFLTDLFDSYLNGTDDDTDDLDEGSTNQYFTAARAAAAALFNLNNAPATDVDDDHIIHFRDGNTAHAITFANFKTAVGATSQPMAMQPRISAFSIGGWSSSIAAGSNVGGNRNIAWTMSNVSAVQGNLSLHVNGRIISSSITPTASGSVTVNLGTITLESGDSATAFLSGVSTTGSTFTSPIATASSPAATSTIFYGASTTNNVTSTVLQGLTTGVFQSGPQTLSIPAWTSNRYLIYAQRAVERDVTQFSVGVQNVSGAFNKGASNITVSGVEYEYWVSRFPYIPSSFPNGIMLTIHK